MRHWHRLCPPQKRCSTSEPHLRHQSLVIFFICLGVSLLAKLFLLLTRSCVHPGALRRSMCFAYTALPRTCTYSRPRQLLHLISYQVAATEPAFHLPNDTARGQHPIHRSLSCEQYGIWGTKWPILILHFTIFSRPKTRDLHSLTPSFHKHDPFPCKGCTLWCCETTLTTLNWYQFQFRCSSCFGWTA